MSTITIIITAATFFLIGAGIGHLFARKNQTGDHSVEELEKINSQINSFTDYVNHLYSLKTHKLLTLKEERSVLLKKIALS